MNARERFLRACRREPVDRVPVWLMRQAGRYMEEYRALRQRHDFLSLCTNPELAVEVTCQPLERLGVDAAILFSDLLIPFLGMGFSVTYHEKRGPVISPAEGSHAGPDRFTIPDAARDFAYLPASIEGIRREIGPDFPLIGFCGAPFTMVSYLIEGGSSHSFQETLTFMYRQPDRFSTAMGMMTRVLIDYALLQVHAGVDALQIFDTWAGCLTPYDFETLVAPWIRELTAALIPTGIPIIYFIRGSAGLLSSVSSLGVNVVSIDSFQDLAEARQRLGWGLAVQGNLEPMCLTLSDDALVARVRSMLKIHASKPGWIFNLGHGILPFLEASKVKLLVNTVKEYGQTGHIIQSNDRSTP